MVLEQGIPSCLLYSLSNHSDFLYVTYCSLLQELPQDLLKGNDRFDGGSV